MMSQCTDQSLLLTVQNHLFALYQFPNKQDDDFNKKAENIYLIFNQVLSTLDPGTQTKIKERIVKNIEALNEPSSSSKLKNKIVLTAVALQILDQDSNLTSLKKISFEDEMYALNFLTKKRYIPISSILKRYQTLCQSFDCTDNEKIIQNILRRADRNKLNLSERISLFNPLLPKLLKDHVFNFIKEALVTSTLKNCTLPQFDSFEVLSIVSDDLSIVNFCPNLKSLELMNGNCLSDNDLKFLSHLKLEKLSIENSSIKGEGLCHIMHMPLESLRVVGGGKLQNDALYHIGKIDSLKHLDVSDNDITNEALLYLKNPSLQSLAIGLTPITEITALTKIPLKKLSLRWMENVQEFKSILPNLLEIKELEILDLAGMKINPEELLSLSQLPLKHIDLRQGVTSTANCLRESDLLKFAQAIKKLHNIHVNILSGTMLLWSRLILKEDNKFNIANVVKK